MQKEIVEKITEYLERNTLITSVSGETPFECRYQFAAEQIAEIISPYIIRQNSHPCDEIFNQLCEDEFENHVNP